MTPNNYYLTSMFLQRVGSMPVLMLRTAVCSGPIRSA
jgi:hypothetical protein